VCFKQNRLKMPITLKLFGDLRKKGDPKVSGTLPLRLKIDDPEITWVADILRKFMIEENEVSHIFVNGRFAGFRKKVNNGDTVASVSYTHLTLPTSDLV